MKLYQLCLAALSLAIAPYMSAQSPSSSQALQVEILIFSGRPNPVFTVTDPAEIREIISLVKGLPAPSATSAITAESRPALGYQGIAVKSSTKVTPDADAFVVHRSTVRLARTAPSTSQAGTSGSSAAVPAVNEEVRTDSSTALERRLLTLAQGHGAIDSAVFAYITSGK